jgi:hypothetical protein
VFQNVRITADTVNNTVLVYSNQEDYRVIERALHDFDRPRLQVAIEATVAEVTLTNELTYGVQYFLSGRSVGLVSAASAVAQTAAPAALQPVPGAFNLLLGSQKQPSVILDALSTITNVKILSSPSIVALDNEPALLEVGDQVPISTGSATILTGANTPVVNTIELHNISGIGTGLLPSANNVAVNWQKAGMQSVGGIPNRTAVCATVNPIGGGSDDAPNINTAITNCTAGQVVQLGAGTFSVYSQASGHSPINLNKGVTLRGTGTCTNASTPYCSTVINLADGTIPFGTTCGTQNACDNNNAPAIVAGVSQQYLRWSKCDAGSTLNCSSAISVAADLAQGATSVQVAVLFGGRSFGR